MKVKVLVVLYNKKPEDSDTLRSLADNKHICDLVIFNNGPDIFSEDVIFITKLNSLYNLTIIQNISNLPLSVIYNHFINDNPSKEYQFYAIFDDDSYIPTSYFNEIFQDIDLYVPVIKNKDNDIFYPSVNHKRYITGQIINKNDIVFSIGSGLMIGRKIIDKFQKQSLSLFDERFALYGVDFSLFRRIEILKKKGIDFNIQVNSYLIHQLSYDSGDVSLFRNHERDIDYILSHKWYSGKNSAAGLFFLLKFLLRKILSPDNNLNVRVSHILRLIAIYFKGKHPRC